MILFMHFLQILFGLFGLGIVNWPVIIVSLKQTQRQINMRKHILNFSHNLLWRLRLRLRRRLDVRLNRKLPTMVCIVKVRFLPVHELSYKEEKLLILCKQSKLMNVLLPRLDQGWIRQALHSFSFFLQFFLDRFVVSILFQHAFQYDQIWQLFWLELIFRSWMVHFWHPLNDFGLVLWGLNWFLLKKCFDYSWLLSKL